MRRQEERERFSLQSSRDRTQTADRHRQLRFPERAFPRHRLSNNSVLQKRHRSFRGRDAALRRPYSAACCLYLDFTEMFLGKLGRFFAAMMNAIPIATRKNEKNWPRVNGPINSASGSRKFSIMIRKTA